MTRRAWVRGASAAAGLLLALGWSGTAWASCAPPPPMEQAIAEAKQVFVGTVQALADEDHRATVRVEEVWKGPDVALVVEVWGSPGGSEGEPVARTSVDRTYSADTKYLFVLFDDSAPYSDNVCSRTSEWTEEHAAHRPADWRHPVSAPSDGAPGDGEMGITSTGDGQDAGGASGEGSGEPISYGPDGETDEELADNSGMVDGGEATGSGEQVDAEPVASVGGMDGRLLLGVVAGLAALVLAAWWLRREA